MTDATPLVVVEELTKRYSITNSLGTSRTTVDALAGVSLTVREGQSVGIVGESGSGKSTLAKILIGLEAPSSGTVRVGDMSLGPKNLRARGRRELAKQIQIVFQNPYQSLDRRQTILECLTEPLRLHSQLRGGAIDERAYALLDQVGLDRKVARSRPSSLSGGQRQRVSIARALAVDPKVLILDESVSALDVSVQAQVLNLISELRRLEQLTLIFITHDLAVANHMCDELVVLKSGEVVERGPVRQVIDTPSHSYTRELIAAVPGGH